MKPYYQDDSCTLYNGDCLNTLKNLPSESINCTITSPPYWALRDYGVEGQLGLEPTFDEYIDKLCDIFDEVKRVLRKDGTCWVVIGDTYASGGGLHVEQSVKRQSAIDTGAYPDNPPNSKIRKDMGKSLIMIPFRFAIEMVNRGWILRNTIIWHKPNCMPASVDDRFTVDFEYVFFFVKNKKYWFEQQLMETLTRDNSNRNRDITKLNNTPGRSRMAGLKTNNYEYKNKRTVWKVNTKPYKEAHFAVFPKELIDTPLKAGCPKGGIVLDPFLGSGTTARACKDLGRKCIGIEISKEYCDIAVKSLAQEVLF